MYKQEIKNNLIYLLVSICVAFVNPYLDICGFIFNKSNILDKILKQRFILPIVCIFLLIVYSKYMYKKFRKFKYFNFINYPVAVLNIWFLFQGTFIGVAGAIQPSNPAWGMLLYLPFFCVVIYSVVAMCYGFTCDIKSWREYFKSKK